MPGMRLTAFLTLLPVLVLVSPGASGALVDPVNFTQTTFANVGANATSMAWAPDGSNRAFVTMKDGRVVVIKNGVVLGTTFSTDVVFTNSECGLLGIAFDPNFIQNGYVYLFETVSSSQQQIVRYTASGDVGTSKTVIVAGLPTVGVNHDGGGLGFGPDGKLYWSIGDLGNGAGVNADLSSLASKVGRANRDGSPASGNPFADGAGPNNEYVWARGLRNPFALAFQPGTGALWVDVAGTSYEQIFIVSAGSHAGYNQYENNQPAGFITPSVVYRTNGIDARVLAPGGAGRSGGVATFTTTTAHGFRKGGKVSIAGVADASFNGGAYVLSTPSPTTFTLTQAGADATSNGGSATTASIGGAVTGGDFWSSGAVPLAYRGNYLFGDFNSGNIERVTLAADNTVTSVDHFATGVSQAVDVAPGPDGAIYLLSLPGGIQRVSYLPSAQGIVVTPLQLRLDEGGRALVSVRLAQAPAANTSLSINLTGDADVSLVNSSALTFTSANWATPQSVVLQATSDADVTEDLASLTFASAGLTSESVAVRATDLAGSSSPTVAAVPVAGGRMSVLLAAAMVAAGLAALRKR